MNRKKQDIVAALTDISDMLGDALEKIDRLDDLRIKFEDDDIGRTCEGLRDRLIEKTAEEIKAVVLARL